MVLNRRRALLVGGTFGNNPSHSKLAEEVFNAIKDSQNYINITIHNGGRFSDLEKIAGSIKSEGYDIIVWMANVPEEHEKIVKNIKVDSPTCLLVTSKRNLDGKYSIQDIIYHALNIKSNLVLEIFKATDSDRYGCRILDPLCNCFEDTSDFSKAGRTLAARLQQLMWFTRIRSICAGKNRKIPVEDGFLSIIREHAEIFHDCIHPHPEATTRFFGNASFRCESGFPSFKQGNYIYVTRRNVDKRQLDRTAFVPVRVPVRVPMNHYIEYYGQHKPSVDTPIQVLLYEYYKNAKYMLHSHAYLVGCKFTSKVIPCGNVEEADEITKVVRDKQAVNFGVNLIGHGSILIADNIEFIKRATFVARPQPEYQIV